MSSPAVILGHGDIVLHLEETSDVVTSGVGGGVCLCVDNFEWGRGVISGNKELSTNVNWE